MYDVRTLYVYAETQYNIASECYTGFPLPHWLGQLQHPPAALQNRPCVFALLQSWPSFLRFGLSRPCPCTKEKGWREKRARQYELTKKELRMLGVVHQKGGERKEERRRNMGERRPRQENENRRGKRRVDERTDRRRRTKTTIEHGNMNGTVGFRE
jgi:hypothetical protein